MGDEKQRSVPLPVFKGKEGTPGAAGPVIDRGVWYAEGLRFECTQCGNCCTGAPGYVWLTVEDMHRIASYLKIAFDEFTRTYVRQVGAGSKARYSLTEKENYDCSFLTRNSAGKAGCSIYPVRPMQCRTWPFWSGNLKSPGAWKRAAENTGGGSGCPGMCAGDAPKYDLPHIETCRQHVESP